MAHPLVDQLRFTRGEWLRALDGVTDADARRRIGPMNSISWIIGHLAWQEQRYWLYRAQGVVIRPELDELAGYGSAPNTPPLDEVLAAWREVTTAADPYLDTLATEALLQHYQVDGRPVPESAGTLLRRVTYHYWFHIGEILAIRQQLGHTALPEYVGDIGDEAPYRPEPTTGG